MSYNIFSFIMDAVWGILFLAAGLFMLFAPFDKAQKIFPKLPSKKVCKVVGVFLTLCGIVYMALMLI